GRGVEPGPVAGAGRGRGGGGRRRGRLPPARPLRRQSPAGPPGRVPGGRGGGSGRGGQARLPGGGGAGRDGVRARLPRSALLAKRGAPRIGVSGEAGPVIVAVIVAVGVIKNVVVAAHENGNANVDVAARSRVRTISRQ